MPLLEFSMEEQTCNIQLKHRREYLQDVKVNIKRLRTEKSTLLDIVDAAKADLGRCNDDIKKKRCLVKVVKQAIVHIKSMKPALDQKLQ